MKFPNFILMKNINERHSNDFIDKGEIHFESIQYFRDKELREHDKTIGDKDELYIVKRHPLSDSIRVEVDHVDVTDVLRNNNYGYAVETKYTSNETSFWNISCFTMLKFDDEEVFEHHIHNEVSVKDNKIHKVHDFNLRQSYLQKIRQEVGGKKRRTIIIFPHFFNHLEKFVKESKINVICRPVTYYSNEDQSNVDSSLSKDKQLIQSAFSKKDRYISQKELRLLIAEKLDKNSKNIYLGNLSDCALEINKQFKITITEKE